MPKEFKVEVKVRNNLILAAMVENEIPTVAELCRRMKTPGNFSQSRVGEIINLKVSPRNQWGAWRPIVLRMAKVLKRLPEDLFTSEQEQMALQSNRGSFEVSFEEVRGLLEARKGGHTPEAIARARQLHFAVEKILHSLTPREERVIRLRFGLGGVEEHTLDQVGEQMGLNRETIRKIQDAALRKLRHPSRSKSIIEVAGTKRVKRTERPRYYGEHNPGPLIIEETESFLDDEVLDAARDDIGVG